jgi:hypothetical protein
MEQIYETGHKPGPKRRPANIVHRLRRKPMADHVLDGVLERESADTDRWLKIYYLLRGAVSLVWVAAALTVGPMSPMIAGALLLIYPAWDALANVIDARQNGGLRRNRPRRSTWSSAA